MMVRLTACAFVCFALINCGSDDPASNGSGGGSNSGGSTSGGSNSGGSSGAGAATTGGASSGGTAGSGGAAGGGGTTSGALPEGDNGIASKYPGDAGIQGVSAVIFADDFESYSKASDLDKNWDFVFQYSQIRFATESANVFAGAKALEFSVPQQNNELSNSTGKTVSPERDALFLRYYSKFDTPFDVVGSSHNGSSISAHYFENGNATPGVPADGKNKFLANLENWRGDAGTKSPGPMNIYIYHPDQRSQWGDHFFPTGTVLPNSSQKFDFGPNFVSRPDVTPELGKWYCYEFMLQANTPGKKDGRIAFWLDGKLHGDFPNLRLRDVPSLKIDRFALDFHIGSNPNGLTKKWYDNVVAASSYIGPLKK
ncbi:MAG TPA: hypothetical protein PKA88_07020 [Polyangiaceae bacterium]|nr:hypothetical protein [Polyangiaceae bacterium]